MKVYIGNKQSMGRSNVWLQVRMNNSKVPEVQPFVSINAAPCLEVVEGQPFDSR